MRFLHYHIESIIRMTGGDPATKRKSFYSLFARPEFFGLGFNPPKELANIGSFTSAQLKIAGIMYSKYMKLHQATAVNTDFQTQQLPKLLFVDMSTQESEHYPEKTSSYHVIRSDHKTGPLQEGELHFATSPQAPLLFSSVTNAETEYKVQVPSIKKCRRMMKEFDDISPLKNVRKLIEFRPKIIKISGKIQESPMDKDPPSNLLPVTLKPVKGLRVPKLVRQSSVNDLLGEMAEARGMYLEDFLKKMHLMDLEPIQG